jgi:hypothetical protein
MDWKRVSSFAVALLTLGAFVAAPARSEVRVSLDIPVSRTEQASVDAASWKAVPIGQFSPGRPIKVMVNFAGGTGDLSAAIIDEANLNFFRQKLPYRAQRSARQLPPIALEGPTWSYGNYYLLLDNTHAVLASRQVAYRVEYMDKADPESVKALKEMLEKTYAALKEDFVFSDFNIDLKPCGQANAFSAPDITICTELVMDFVAKRRMAALAPVIVHELGHTLLNLWGMPGYDNEDIADEFAAVVLLSGDKDTESGARALSDMITWFSEQDAKAQAVGMLVQGDRHALSIQRVRNLQRIMEDPNPVIARWNRLLYRQMTAKALQRIESSPGAHDDPQLARQILATLRAESAPPVTVTKP